MSRLLIRVLALSLIAEACILCSEPSVRTAGANPPAGQGYVQDWADEFDGAALDTVAHWNYSQLGHTDPNLNTTRDAVSVAGGRLTIKTYTANGQHYTGIISTGEDPGRAATTDDKYTPKYGYFEAKIDFNGASGMWSSFFLTDKMANQPSPPAPDDPRLRGTEIDVVEHRVQDQNFMDISDKGAAALHWENTTSAGSGLKTGNPP